jgi:hypothetical protein
MAGKRKGGMTKMEAVRQALAELGKDAKPLQLRAFVKERFGIDMTADHVSTYKGQILRKQQGAGRALKAKAAKPPAAPNAEPGQAAPTPQPKARGTAAGIGLGDITAVKDLVERVGADTLKQLIDVLAR